MQCAFYVIFISIYKVIMMRTMLMYMYIKYLFMRTHLLNIHEIKLLVAHISIHTANGNRKLFSTLNCLSIIFQNQFYDKNIMSVYENKVRPRRKLILV